jgi:hypothetical protein
MRFDDYVSDAIKNEEVMLTEVNHRTSIHVSMSMPVGY